MYQTLVRLFLYNSFVVIRISLLHVYNKIPLGAGGGDTEGKYWQGLKPYPVN